MVRVVAGRQRGYWSGVPFGLKIETRGGGELGQGEGLVYWPRSILGKTRLWTAFDLLLVLKILNCKHLQDF